MSYYLKLSEQVDLETTARLLNLPLLPSRNPVVHRKSSFQCCFLDFRDCGMLNAKLSLPAGHLAFSFADILAKMYSAFKVCKPQCSPCSSAAIIKLVYAKYMLKIPLETGYDERSKHKSQRGSAEFSLYVTFSERLRGYT